MEAKKHATEYQQIMEEIKIGIETSRVVLISSKQSLVLDMF